MRIGIDISQTAYEGTGVGHYLTKLVQHLLTVDKENQYVLFYSSLRIPIQKSKFKIQNYNSKVKVKTFRIPPTVLDLLWNKLHILPIEWFIGNVDVFITSDWTEPPARKAKKATVIYDFIIQKFPAETHNLTEFRKKEFAPSANIVAVQKRKLKWVKKESEAIFVISEATKKDVVELLGIDTQKIHVIYPGL